MSPDIWIIHDWSDEVHRYNECSVGCNLPDGSVVSAVGAYQQIRMARNWQLAQYLSQVARRELAGSASAVTVLGEPNWGLIHGSILMRIALGLVSLPNIVVLKESNQWV